MNICRGSVNSRLLIGAAVFIASFVFFQWLQVERVTNNSHHEMPKVDDETVVLTKPGQQSRPASAKRDTKPEPADDNPRPSTNLQAVVTEASRGPDGSELVALPARARTETEQATYDEPQGDLAISGRVLTRSGSPVAGIQVTATATHLFEQGQRKAIPPGRGQRRTTTDYNGAYAFENLANGEYQLRTVATDRYTRALIHVRAGVDFADLIVATHQEIRVQGIVTTEEGDPLFGAKVRPNLAGASEVTTNWEGHYGFDAMLPENVTQMMVRASHEGYRDREIRLAADHSDDANALELNIIMQADAATELADVSGFVTNAARDPVAGQRVLLSSATPRQTYRSITDASGTFVIRGVEPGDDYMVSINATETYEDYFQKNVVITKNGLTLNIELAARDTGVLRGQMVNMFNNAVADFSLVLQTKARSYYNQQVIGDAAGHFVVEKAPVGELLLKTKSNPYYSIEGIRLAADAELQVTVVLDWGYDEIHGRVVGEYGSPIAVPNVTLTWKYEHNGIRTSARRTAAADEQGYFHFSQLGPGNHRLTVNAAGYKPVSLNHDVAMQGSEIVVELAAK